MVENLASSTPHNKDPETYPVCHLPLGGTHITAWLPNLHQHMHKINGAVWSMLGFQHNHKAHQPHNDHKSE